MPKLTTLKPRLKPMGPRLQSTRQVRDTRFSSDAELRSKYKVKRWSDLRLEILVRDLYQCQMCGVFLAQGKDDDRAALVDHIRPAKLCPELFYEPTNLQACCRRCHVTTCAYIEARHSGDADAIEAAKRGIRPAA
jgi:5-methylcytosine-specific restriction endonuclease McrA